MVMLNSRLPQQNIYPKTNSKSKSQNQHSSNVAFGEGFTQRFVNIFLPKVAHKQEEIQKDVSKQSNEALGLIGTLMAHHIDPKIDVVPLPAVQKLAADTKPSMVTVDATTQTSNMVAGLVAKMNAISVKPDIKPVVPNNAFQDQTQQTVGQKLNVVA